MYTIDWSAATTDGSGNIYVTTNTLVDGEKANILTTKYNSSGVVQWEVSYNSTGDDNDYGTAICVDGSGNVYVAASSYISGNNYDYRTIKYNSSGTIQWNVTYNGPGNFYDVPTGIAVDGSGNVYVTGGSYGSSTLSDFCTIKYNSSGTSQWTSRYNYASDQDIAAIIKFSPSGRVIVAGRSAASPGSWDFASIKYNQTTGAQLAENRNSASGAGFDEVYAAETDASGNIYLVGRAAVIDEGYNMRTIKIDTSISVVWARNYDHVELNDEAHGIVVDLSDNVYVTGWVTNTDGTKSFETLKYNSSGTLQWSNEENADNSGLDAYALKISNTVYPYLMVAGNVDNGASLDFMSVIYNTDGDRLWIEQYDDPDKSDDKVNFVKTDLDGNFYVGGKSYAVSTATNRLIKYNWNSYIIPPDDDMAHPTSFTFFENKGQIIDTDNELREDIKYYTHRHNPSLYFTDDVLSYVWSRIDTTSANDTLSRIDLSFPGSNGTKVVNRAVSQAGEYLNYYLDHCADGITNVRSSDRLIITDLYDDVDLEFFFDEAGIKYYLIIKPGYSEQNDPISLLYDGAEEVNILGGGELEIVGLLGTLKQEIAEAYQIDGAGDLVTLGWDADFVVIDDFEIGFDLGAYDDELPLIIEMKFEPLIMGALCEPNLFWGTWYGGDDDDILTDVKINSADYPALYISGATQSTATEFPSEYEFINELTGTAYDIFIQKINLDEYNPIYDMYQPYWGSYVGGSDNEYLYGSKNSKLTIIESLEGNGKKIYFTGLSESDDLPVIDNAPGDPDNLFDPDLNSGMDGILGMMSSMGYLNWLTYIGGSTDNTRIYGIDKTYDDGIIIVGYSRGGDDFPFYDPSGTFPFHTSLRSGFIIELDNVHHLKLGTLFGSTSTDQIYDVVVDNNNDYIITGYTYGIDFPITTGGCYGTSAGASDIFVTKIRIDGDDRDLDWSTYYGGAGDEYGYAITNDLDNNLFVTGATFNFEIDESERFPLISGDFFNDNVFTEDAAADCKGFILKISEEGDCLWATLFGGDNRTFPRDITNNNENIVIVGNQIDANGNFPLEPSDYEDVFFDDFDDAEGSGGATSFVSMFNNNTDLLWSTFIGDNAHNGAVAATINTNYSNQLFITGFISYDYLIDDFLPLCNPGGDALFMDHDAGGIDGNDGFIVGFDLSAFPIFITSVNDDAIIIDEPKINPNPTLDIINIKFPDLNLYNLTIFDMMGSEVCSGNTYNLLFIKQ